MRDASRSNDTYGQRGGQAARPIFHFGKAEWRIDCSLSLVRAPWGQLYTGTPILEQRFSIHPSLKSAEFTTVKHTTNLADGKRIVHTALTDAVKGKTGFFMIFARRAPIMSADKYFLSERRQEPQHHCRFARI